MPQGTLAPNGSQLELEYWTATAPSVANRNLRIGIGGTTFNFQNLGISSSVVLQRGSAIVTRLSATTIAVAVKSESYSVSGNIISTENYYTTAAVTNLDSGGALAVTLQSVIPTTGNIVTEYFTIKRNLI
jgi:hypothetical protein